MGTELTLKQTGTSGPLVPARCTHALSLISKLAPSGPRGTMRGLELRLSLALPLEDDACAAFLPSYPAQGARIEVAAHGPSVTLLTWAFHAIAATLKSEITVDGETVAADPEPFRAAATAYLEGYEADVLAARKARPRLDGTKFVAWLALEEQVALGDSGSFAELPMDDPARLYEMLLEHDGVEEVFVSERELSRLLTRFKARVPR